MAQRSSLLLLLLAAGMAGGGCARGPEAQIRGLVRAMSQGDEAAIRTYVVTAARLAELVECSDERAPWLTPAGRTAKLDQMIARASRFSDEGIAVAVTSFEGNYYPREWRSYKAGEPIREGCKARGAFSHENYRIELGITERFGHSHTSNKPIAVWHIGDEWQVWDNPMDAEVIP